MQITFDTNKDSIETVQAVVSAAYGEPAPSTTLEVKGIEPEALIAPGTLEPAQDDLDSEGLPYDARIHSSSKGTNKDGTWKLKRGVDKELVKQVKAELLGAPTPPPASLFAAEEMPGAAPPVLVPVPPPVAKEFTFADILQKATSGTITSEQLNTAVEAAGLKSFPELVNHPDKVQEVAAALGLN